MTGDSMVWNVVGVEGFSTPEPNGSHGITNRMTISEPGVI